jgi:hypothetical protein
MSLAHVALTTLQDARRRRSLALVAVDYQSLLTKNVTMERRRAGRTAPSGTRASDKYIRKTVGSRELRIAVH